MPTNNTTGSYAQVWHGTAKKTEKGGYTKNQLMKTKYGRIVPKKKHMDGVKKFKALLQDPTFRAKWQSHKKSQK